ncbi:hypothetical protein [Vreelandella nigrificans]|uniref:hypothetical protein n=1 Tax=Vreelandella nigrificans TaxID=2042704 RepID=UPI001054E8A5|nr:hypothetical protein [Halomonas nigrificans]
MGDALNAAPADLSDPEGRAIRYMGFQLPDRWHHMGIPDTRFGVEDDWMRNSVHRFQYEEDFKQEYHQGKQISTPAPGRSHRAGSP